MHPLEKEYGLTAYQLLDALSKRFRAKVTLEGAVAEEQLALHIQNATKNGVIERYEEHDVDGHPDFSIWLPNRKNPILVECKNVRNHNEAYRENGKIVAYKVETQKTRTSNNDPSSRFYGVNQFDILGVCLGKKIGNWNDFLFIRTKYLSRHKNFPEKLSVMHRVPLKDNAADLANWYNSLSDLLLNEYKK
ncbi:hypothetical protein [Leptospira interrogans]|uniref:hypothetical protein n=1 Tax=Leptospira interrogans TaxID=173 RepID=UPI0007748AD9|nr:hypothetical protein [Leptospira interrogans]